ncbi:PrsW family intramembrane metalloprotease [Halomicrococcus gelatinilyticus]|uniref:PrsW family intramembrane metalloprotease n=1 Tax=Halomicrococcus gelatinilyticus TaxID=1702103 RepID=UPI002E1431FB
MVDGGERGPRAERTPDGAGDEGTDDGTVGEESRESRPGAVVRPLLFVRLSHRTTLLLAVVLVLVELLLVGVTVVDRPALGVLAVLSVGPALAIAGYIWLSDPEREPLRTLVTTFVLGVLFASFAGVVNTLGVLVLYGDGASRLALVPFFFLFVAPVEEFVKWLAVRFHAYRTHWFGSTVDGVVYGAMAGLGFATIENLSYVVGSVAVAGRPDVFVTVADVAVTRAIVGPNHVIWAAISGYYLGLADVVPANRSRVALTGVAVAALFHGFYNSTVGPVTDTLAGATGVDGVVWLLLYVVASAGVAGTFLMRKLRHSRAVYEETREGEEAGDDGAASAPERGERAE